MRCFARFDIFKKRSTQKGLALSFLFHVDQGAGHDRARQATGAARAVSCFVLYNHAQLLAVRTEGSADIPATSHNHRGPSIVIHRFLLFLSSLSLSLPLGLSLHKLFLSFSTFHDMHTLSIFLSWKHTHTIPLPLYSSLRIHHYVCVQSPTV